MSTQDVTNPVTLPSIYSVYDVPVLLDCMQYFLISYTIGPADILHPLLLSLFGYPDLALFAYPD